MGTRCRGSFEKQPPALSRPCLPPFAAAPLRCDTHAHTLAASPPLLSPTAALPHPPLLPPGAALSNQEALKERKLGALHQALAMYQRRLGLDFQHSEADGEQLRVVVTQVDPRDHARAFQFAVQVVGDNSYAGALGARFGRAARAAAGLGSGSGAHVLCLCSSVKRGEVDRRALRLCIHLLAEG